MDPNIFKSSYHNHLLTEFNFFSFNMYVKKSYNYAIIYIMFISSLTIFNLTLKQWYHSKLQFSNGHFICWNWCTLSFNHQDLNFSSSPTLKLNMTHLKLSNWRPHTWKLDMENLEPWNKTLKTLKLDMVDLKSFKSNTLYLKIGHGKLIIFKLDTWNLGFIHGRP
jgi:hypothetical protein